MNATTNHAALALAYTMNKETFGPWTVESAGVVIGVFTDAHTAMTTAMDAARLTDDDTFILDASGEACSFWQGLLTIDDED